MSGPTIRSFAGEPQKELTSGYKQLDPALLTSARLKADCLAYRYGTAGNSFESACLLAAFERHLLDVEGKGPEGWLWNHIDPEARHTLGMDLAPWTEFAVNGWFVSLHRRIPGSTAVHADRWLASLSIAPDFYAVLELADGPGPDVLYRWVGWCPAGTVAQAPVRLDPGKGRLAQLQVDALSRDAGGLLDELKKDPPARDATGSKRGCGEARRLVALSWCRGEENRDAFEHFAACRECSRWRLEARPVVGAIMAPPTVEYEERSVALRGQRVRTRGVLAAAEEAEGPVALAVVDAATGDLLEDWQGRYSGQHQHHATRPEANFYLDLHGLPKEADAVVFFVPPGFARALEGRAATLEGCLAAAYQAYRRREEVKVDFTALRRIGLSTGPDGQLYWRLDMEDLRGHFAIQPGAGILVAVRR